MAISDRGTPVGKQYEFRAPPSAARRIADAGVDVANLANNHARDFGPVALMDTVELLEAAGVVALGAGADDAEAYRYGSSMPAGWPPSRSSACRTSFPGASPPPPTIRAWPPGWTCARLRDRPGGERRSRRCDCRRALGHRARYLPQCGTAGGRRGATGCRRRCGDRPPSSCAAAVEFGDGKLVAYSLGNFIWHPRWGITGDTGVLQLDFDADRLVGWSFPAHLLDENGARARLRRVIATTDPRGHRRELRAPPLGRSLTPNQASKGITGMP